MDSPTTPTGHVFISYAREDQPYARKLSEGLRQRGFEVWMDDRIEFGDDWWEVIVEAIRASAAFVVVMTPNSENSDWVDKEILLAFEERKPAFPLLLRGKRFPIYVDTQYADVTGGRTPPDDFYERLGLVVGSFEELGCAPDFEAGRGQDPAEAGDLFSQGTKALIAGDLSEAKRYYEMTLAQDPFYPQAKRQLAIVEIQLAVGVPESAPRAAYRGQRERLLLAVLWLLVLVIGGAVVVVFMSGLIGGGAVPAPIPKSQPPSIGSLHDTWTRPADGMEMVYVPAGIFQMGSTEFESDEQPVHAVMLDSFWLDETEVTNDQFERFAQATGYRTDAEKQGTGWVFSDGSWSEVDGADWQHPNGPETSISDQMDHPVVQVTWNDATTYCQWAGGRLPTEAEWEYSARGPDGHIYPWGNDPPDDALLNYDKIVIDTTEVGSYPDGASWVGAMDMAGNVREWVADWYGKYPSEARTNPKGPETGDLRVQRGGSWDHDGTSIRATYRSEAHPFSRSDSIGFRCVAEPDN